MASVVSPRKVLLHAVPTVRRCGIGRGGGERQEPRVPAGVPLRSCRLDVVGRPVSHGSSGVPRSVRASPLRAGWSSHPWSRPGAASTRGADADRSPSCVSAFRRCSPQLSYSVPGVPRPFGRGAACLPPQGGGAGTRPGRTRDASVTQPGRESVGEEPGRSEGGVAPARDLDGRDVPRRSNTNTNIIHSRKELCNPLGWCAAEPVTRSGVDASGLREHLKRSRWLPVA